MALQTINPATGEHLVDHVAMTHNEVDARIAKAQRAFEVWRLVALEERATKMRALANLLRKDVRAIAMLATQSMGKPITEAIGEVEKCALVCDYYAENTAAILEKEIVETNALESYVRFDPIGIVFAVMPWNFPYWQVFRFIAPAAMAGNVGLLKHASNVQLCAEKMEQLFLDAGFPEGIFQNLAISSSDVARVIENPLVRATTLTGSEYAGSQVAKVSGENIKKSVLELGGSDPFIVLADADVSKAAQTAVKARLLNCGQSCIAAKRFILERSIADAFIDEVKEGFAKMIPGDPTLPETLVGPLVHRESRDEIHALVTRSIAEGGEVLCGGVIPEGQGAYYPPTIVRLHRKEDPLRLEETFGPVMSIIVVENEEETIAIANETTFGLGSSLWTTPEHAQKLIPRIEAGCVFVNSMVKSDPRLPFGGIKRSGFGRELSSYGMREFLNIKSVWIET